MVSTSPHFHAPKKCPEEAEPIYACDTYEGAKYNKRACEVDAKPGDSHADAGGGMLIHALGLKLRL